MTALVLMRQGDGWSVFRDGARLNEPLARGPALELAFRLASSAARAGVALSMVVDEDPEGDPGFGFRMHPEPPLYFRPREARSFEADAGVIVLPPRA
ncbi:MAG TPA: hypothetical protein VEA79_07410 [Phenylobacterium sp.]|nr:hypothetical protein [Phenylobacterium sp.]